LPYRESECQRESERRRAPGIIHQTSISPGGDKVLPEFADAANKSLARVARFLSRQLQVCAMICPLCQNWRGISTSRRELPVAAEEDKIVAKLDHKMELKLISSLTRDSDLLALNAIQLWACSEIFVFFTPT